MPRRHSSYSNSVDASAYLVLENVMDCVRKRDSKANDIDEVVPSEATNPSDKTVCVDTILIL